METTQILSSFLLSKNDTLNFESDLNLNCMNVDFMGLVKTFIKFNLSNHQDYKDFIQQAEEIFNLLNNEDLAIGLEKVTPFNSICIACSFGKKVNAYQVSYYKLEHNFRINYTGVYAINLKIEEGMLLEFAFCNAFLSQKEIQKI